MRITSKVGIILLNPHFPCLIALVDADLSINYPMMWLQGGIGDQGLQSLNFQRFGGASWVQPRLDASTMSGLSPDLYQAMKTAAFHELRTVDPAKLPSQSLLQFQQPQTNFTTSDALLQRQILQPSQSQSSFLHRFQDTEVSSQQDSEQVTRTSVQHQVPSFMSSLPQYTSTTQGHSASLQQNFSDVPSLQNILGTMSQDHGASLVHNLSGSNHSSPLLRKPITVEAPLASEAIHCALPKMEELGTSHSNDSEFANMLPPFPGREYSEFQGGGDQQSNVLFGVNMLQSGMPQLRNFGSESNNAPYNGAGVDFPLNSDMTASSCVGETGFLQSAENMDQVNHQKGTFVKVSVILLFAKSNILVNNELTGKILWCI